MIKEKEKNNEKIETDKKEHLEKVEQKVKKELKKTSIKKENIQPVSSKNKTNKVITNTTKDSESNKKKAKKEKKSTVVTQEQKNITDELKNKDTLNNIEEVELEEIEKSFESKRQTDQSTKKQIVQNTEQEGTPNTKKENKNETENVTKNTNPTSFKAVEPDQQKKSKHILLTISIFLAIFLCLIIIIFTAFTIYNYKNNSIISKGIYINNIDISSLTKEEAKSKLEKYYTDILSNDITLIHNDYTTYIKTSEINLKYDINEAVNYAYTIGKTNNIFKDNYQVFNAMTNGINITPTYSIDENSLKNILNTLSSELPDAVVESGYYIEGDNLIITKGSDGNAIDVETTTSEIKKLISDLSYINKVAQIRTIVKSPQVIDLDKIYKEVYTEAKNAYYTTNPYTVYPSSNGIDFGISIDEAKNLLQTADKDCTIPLKVLYPNVTTNMIGQEAFPDLLATFSTKYAASNTNRTTNLRLAANKINGHVLLPNEIFSYNTVVGERTISAGYKEAAVYQNGEVVQGLGGGICQISTTLYNAVLFSNLEIVELHNHQFVPSYVTAGRDATVVYGIKDFKFKNTRKHAIKITCSVSGGVATFKIWGVKEDPEYDISVYATVNSRTSSYIKSSTYRTIKKDGQTIKNENIINSTYKVH